MKHSLRSGWIMVLALASGVVTGHHFRPQTLVAPADSSSMVADVAPPPSRKPFPVDRGTGTFKSKLRVTGPVSAIQFDESGNLLLPPGDLAHVPRLDTVSLDGTVDERNLRLLGLTEEEIRKFRDLMASTAGKATARQKADTHIYHHDEEETVWEVPGNPNGEIEKTRWLQELRDCEGPLHGLLEKRILANVDLEWSWFGTASQLVQLTHDSNEGSRYQSMEVPASVMAGAKRDGAPFRDLIGKGPHSYPTPNLPGGVRKLVNAAE